MHDRYPRRECGVCSGSHDLCKFGEITLEMVQDEDNVIVVVEDYGKWEMMCVLSYGISTNDQTLRVSFAV